MGGKLGRFASVQQPFEALGIGRNGRRVDLWRGRRGVETDVFAAAVVQQGLGRHDLAPVERRRHLRRVGLRVRQSPAVVERLARAFRVRPCRLHVAKRSSVSTDLKRIIFFVLCRGAGGCSYCTIDRRWVQENICAF